MCSPTMFSSITRLYNQLKSHSNDITWNDTPLWIKYENFLCKIFVTSLCLYGFSHNLLDCTTRYWIYVCLNPFTENYDNYFYIVLNSDIRVVFVISISRSISTDPFLRSLFCHLIFSGKFFTLLTSDYKFICFASLKFLLTNIRIWYVFFQYVTTQLMY